MSKGRHHRQAKQKADHQFDTRLDFTDAIAPEAFIRLEKTDRRGFIHENRKNKVTLPTISIQKGERKS